MITSNCSQGLVLCFDVNSSARLVDHSFKAHKALCTVYDDSYDLMVGSYSDSKVRIFNEKGIKFIYFRGQFILRDGCVSSILYVCVFI